MSNQVNFDAQLEFIVLVSCYIPNSLLSQQYIYYDGQLVWEAGRLHSLLVLGSWISCAAALLLASFSPVWKQSTQPKKESNWGLASESSRQSMFVIFAEVGRSVIWPTRATMEWVVKVLLMKLSACIAHNRLRGSFSDVVDGFHHLSTL